MLHERLTYFVSGLRQFPDFEPHGVDLVALFCNLVAAAVAPLDERVLHHVDVGHALLVRLQVAQEVVELLLQQLQTQTVALFRPAPSLYVST